MLHSQHRQHPPRPKVSKTGTLPQVTNTEYLRQTADDMLALLQPAPRSSIPKLHYGSDTTNAFIQVAQILKRATAPPPPAPVPRVPLEPHPNLAPAPRVSDNTAPETVKQPDSKISQAPIRSTAATRVQARLLTRTPQQTQGRDAPPLAHAAVNTPT
jgi:hypothetical protein